jgi:hypothetical protein
MTASSAPRPYSRLETDDELLARIRGVHGSRYSQSPYETVDAFADRMHMQRRIVWCAP